ncbi:VOC family protein [Mycolicibacterium sp. 624]|uniref:VOC family protein n=1 Tax=Mycolicibacterium sp. 624 TaxID=3156314 RepID=UPI003399CDA4
MTTPPTGNPDTMIGRLRSMVVDCKNPEALAQFYASLVGGELDVSDANWTVLTTPHGTRLAFQLSPEHQPPRFPDPAGSQQFHLDIQVDDVDTAERDVLAVGGNSRTRRRQRGAWRCLPRLPRPRRAHFLPRVGHSTRTRSAGLGVRHG